MKFDTALLSKMGGRSKNEDYCDYIELDDCICWIVADGLGGYFGGDVASREAVNEIIKQFKKEKGISEKCIRKYLKSAHENLNEIQKSNDKLNEMRTTIVLLVSNYNSVRWAHVGDSRLYYFNSNKLVYQTKDHSMTQLLVKLNEISKDEIRFHKKRNILLRALGENRDIEFDILKEKNIIKREDVFLMCTDGFWEYVYEDEMEIDLKKSKSPSEWLERMENRLLNRVKGKHDNYSAIAIFTGEE